MFTLDSFENMTKPKTVSPVKKKTVWYALTQQRKTGNAEHQALCTKFLAKNVSKMKNKLTTMEKQVSTHIPEGYNIWKSTNPKINLLKKNLQ